MNAGTPAEALVDFTGGVHMCIDLSKPPLNLWELMCRAGQSKSLMGCGTPQGVRSNIVHKKHTLVVSSALTNCGAISINPSSITAYPAPMQGTPFTSCQFIIGPTQRDKHPS